MRLFRNMLIIYKIYVIKITVRNNLIRMIEFEGAEFLSHNRFEVDINRLRNKIIKKKIIFIQ